MGHQETSIFSLIMGGPLRVRKGLWRDVDRSGKGLSGSTAPNTTFGAPSITRMTPSCGGSVRTETDADREAKRVTTETTSGKNAGTA